MSSEAFDIAVGLAISLNGIVIGMEMDWKTSDNEAIFGYLESIFLALFTVELAVKVYVFRCKYFLLLCHWLDAIIVVSGFCAIGLRLVGDLQTATRQIQLFKFARLLRLVRLIRISTQFRPLWLLVKGLSTCVAPVTATMALLLANCYVFGAVAVEYVSSDPDMQQVQFGRLGHTVGEKFGSMPLALFSLLHLFAINEVGDQGFDIAQQQPLAVLYVGAFVFAVVVALLNLFTGVLAENANSIAANDEELSRAIKLTEWEGCCEELEVLFLEMTLDTKQGADGTSSCDSLTELHHRVSWNHDGGCLLVMPVLSEEALLDDSFKLNMEQLFALCGHELVRERLNLLFAEEEGGNGGLKRLSEFWPLLDKNADGVLSLPEFIEGLASLSQVIRHDLNKSYLWLSLFKEVSRQRDFCPADRASVRPALMESGLTVEQVREEREVQELELLEQRRLHAQIKDLVQRVQVLVDNQMHTEDKLAAIEGALKAKVALRGSRAALDFRRAEPALSPPVSAFRALSASRRARRSKSR